MISSAGKGRWPHPVTRIVDCQSVKGACIVGRSSRGYEAAAKKAPAKKAAAKKTTLKKATRKRASEHVHLTTAIATYVAAARDHLNGDNAGR
ncbi:hypothetical protein ACFC0D_07230 [Streptomyces sp. NPDC056222]|uniref:hypothetical protein n=1 Tax=Streptomyces sp. NPDC056222 TaxID=3345749 RepID=UPI0035DC2010